MLTQTLGIFIDSYREFVAKKIFWISIVISAVLVLAIAAVGFSSEGNLTFLWFEFDVPLEDIGVRRDVFYKFLFMRFGVNVWLAWGATILALASTAGVFPDFISGGAIDLALSKPIGRARLFLTKYAAALLFVALQVAVFSTLCFLVIGLRGDAWEPAIFLAVPLILLFYSFLFCACALFGVITRSAMTALVLTLVFWFVIFVVNAAEGVLLSFRTRAEVRVHTYETTIATLEKRLEDNAASASDDDNWLDRTRQYSTEQGVSMRLAGAKENLESARESAANLREYHRYSLVPKLALPKTGETIELLTRTLIDAADMIELEGGGAGQSVEVDARLDDEGEMTADMREAEQRLTNARTQEILRSRSGFWILSTSLAFEAAVLGIAVWRFSRRDF